MTGGCCGIVGNGGVPASGGGDPQLIYSVDLASLANQNLKAAGDGIQVIAGLDWRVSNTANVSAFEIVNGTGLRVTHSAVSTSERTGAKIALQPGQLAKFAGESILWIAALVDTTTANANKVTFNGFSVGLFGVDAANNQTHSAPGFFWDGGDMNWQATKAVRQTDAGQDRGTSVNVGAGSFDATNDILGGYIRGFAGQPVAQVHNGGSGTSEDPRDTVQVHQLDQSNWPGYIGSLVTWDPNRMGLGVGFWNFTTLVSGNQFAIRKLIMWRM